MEQTFALSSIFLLHSYTTDTLGRIQSHSHYTNSTNSAIAKKTYHIHLFLFDGTKSFIKNAFLFFFEQINCVTFPHPDVMSEQQLLKPADWSYCDYFWVSKVLLLILEQGYQGILVGNSDLGACCSYFVTFSPERADNEFFLCHGVKLRLHSVTH